MTLENFIKPNSPLSIPKKTVLNIIYTQNTISDKFNEILKPFDLSAEQFNVLRILRGQKEKTANMCIIQERMLAKTSNTTRLVDKLLLKNLVTRKVCSNNRRKIEVQITTKGPNLKNWTNLCKRLLKDCPPKSKPTPAIIKGIPAPAKIANALPITIKAYATILWNLTTN